MTIVYSYHKDLDVPGYDYPTLAKAKLIHEALASRDYCKLIEPESLTDEEIHLAHSPFYIKALRAGETTNGFGNNDPNLLRQAFRAAECNVTAAKYAVTHGGNTFSLTSGAHHATLDKSGGYCTINGIILAALLSGAKRTLIIDADEHWGNGCVDIIRRRKLQDSITYVHARTAREIKDIDPTDHDFIIYNDGQDSAFDDCGNVSDIGLASRVVQVRAKDIPTLTLLAGGYNDLLTIVARHLRTFTLLESYKLT